MARDSDDESRGLFYSYRLRSDTSSASEVYKQIVNEELIVTHQVLYREQTPCLRDW